MRELTLDELELISGGSDTDWGGGDIVVVGDGGGDWGDWGDWGDDWYDGDYGDGGGGGDSGNQDLNFPSDFTCSDSVAANVAPTISQLGQTHGAEFGAAIIRNADGTYGLYNDTIHTQYSPSGVNFPAPTDGTVTGFVHNHTWNSTDFYQNYINRYPGSDDWAQADALVSSGAADPATLSIYLVDGWGVVREFHYSDRALYSSMSESDKLQSASLPGAVTGCGG